MALRTLSICAGVGGLDLGVRIARPDARCVAFVEREASAAASLVASMEAGRLHPAAIWSDLRTFVAGEWRGAVDCVLSGDPCQGNSVAGKRLGADDDRWLLDRAIEVFDESGADTFFRENVPGNLAGQLAVAVPALERLGCRVAAGIFSAAEAGASHRRERFFILAHRQGGVRGVQLQQGRSLQARAESGGGSSSLGNAKRGGDCRDEADTRRGSILGVAAQRSGGGCVGAVANTQHQHGDAWPDGPAISGCQGSDDHIGRSGQHLAHTAHDGREGWRKRDWSLKSGRDQDCASTFGGGVSVQSYRASRPFAPGPADPFWGEIVRDAPSLEPAVCRMAHGLAGRIERLRHCGNGVVPLAAALAWVRLHGLLADEAAGGAFRAADDSTARAGQSVVRAAA